MRKLILILFTLLISNTSFGVGEMAGSECTASDQSSRSSEDIVISDSEATTESSEAGSESVRR